MIILSNADVAALLSMPDALAALRRGYADLEQGQALYGPRIDYFLPTSRPDDFFQWGNMVGASLSSGVLALRIKSDIVSWPDGLRQEKYCVSPGNYCGLIVLFQIDDGAPLAIIQDGYIQHMRVGAAAAIGTDTLARREARAVGLLGSGGMARSFLEALGCVRELDRVRVFSPTPEHREDFAKEMGEQLGVLVEAVDAPDDAVRGAEIVLSATSSLVPTIDPSWLAPGAHVTVVTRRELSEGLLRRADMVLQLGLQSLPVGLPVPMMEWKAGGYASYVAGRPEQRERIPTSATAARTDFPTLLDHHLGKVPGRRADDEITVFVATGTQGLQFAAVAGRAYELACAASVGHRCPDEWFLQEIRD